VSEGHSVEEHVVERVPADEVAGAGEDTPAGDGDADQPKDELPGLTPPSRRGGSGRFVPEHVGELGFASQEKGDEAEMEVDLGAVNLIPIQAAKRFEAVPVAVLDEKTLLVAMTDPTNVRAIDDISIMTERDVRPAVASPDDIQAVIAQIKKLDTAVADAIEEGEEEEEESAIDLEVRESAENAPVVKLVNVVIAQAVGERASDIHFEPRGGGKGIRVRYRVDGMLHDATTVPRKMVSGVTSRLKIMGGLDIAERRMPQDGRVSLTVDGHPVDIRVASLPSVNGEKIVLRLLDKEKALLTLEMLGMQEDVLERFTEGFRSTYGAVLVTGPTGSGKTTSLYAALNAINTPEKNIITVEDPVEYKLPGITQMQVNPRIDLTFAQGLRSIIRSDPDVIMVGEMRDSEAARIAIESALTGHLVLTTMHTNDAPTAMSRLTEMGIEPFLSASAVDCVISQRLARVLCEKCKERATVPAEALRLSELATPDGEAEELEVYEARGCAPCGMAGYMGRVGLYEAMIVSSEIRELTIARSSADAIRKVALEQGMRPLEQDGLDKVRKGITTVEEIARVTGSGAAAD